MTAKKRKWTADQLMTAAKNSTSIRQVLFNLNLIPAGGNYAQIKKYLSEFNVDIAHFKGRGWNKGLKGFNSFHRSLESILVNDSNYQSYKLKNRLYLAGLKTKQCEECGWDKKSIDGRIPLELHHINGDRTDNRIENLKVLCPNCHSLLPNYRGRNMNKFKK